MQNPKIGLDDRPVVPTAVEQDHLAAGRELCDVPLEVPLGALLDRGLAQRDDAVVLLVHVPGDPTDRAALAGGVAPLEQHDHATVVVLEVALQRQQLDLVRLELLVPAMALQRLASRRGTVTAGPVAWPGPECFVDV